MLTYTTLAIIIYRISAKSLSGSRGRKSDTRYVRLIGKYIEPPMSFVNPGMLYHPNNHLISIRGNHLLANISKESYVHIAARTLEYTARSS